MGRGDRVQVGLLRKLERGGRKEKREQRAGYGTIFLRWLWELESKRRGEKEKENRATQGTGSVLLAEKQLAG